MHPRIISQIAIKILRLLKASNDNVRGEEVDVVLMDRKMEVVTMIQRAMALPTLRIPLMIMKYDFMIQETVVAIGDRWATERSPRMESKLVQ